MVCFHRMGLFLSLEIQLGHVIHGFLKALRPLNSPLVAESSNHDLYIQKSWLLSPLGHPLEPLPGPWNIPASRSPFFFPSSVNSRH